MTASRRRSTGPDRLTVEKLIERDWGQCAWCGDRPEGERGTGWSIHHRRPRGMGGTRRDDTNSPANLVLLCGTGNQKCHGNVESYRAVSYMRGMLVRQNDDPSQVAIEHAVHGWCYLTHDGEAVTDPPMEAA